MLFAGTYKNTHRTDTVKSIRFFTPELASVDNYWTMTGAKTREGAVGPTAKVTSITLWPSAMATGRSLFLTPPISTPRRPVRPIISAIPR